ncbi:unnamed protein product, partial [Didymodactylos carnosus]
VPAKKSLLPLRKRANTTINSSTNGKIPVPSLSLTPVQIMSAKIHCSEKPLPTNSSLIVGCRVQIGGLKTGILRYVGSVHFAQGQFCGIELDEPDGKHNGEVQNIRYFDCPQNHGVFVPQEKVIVLSSTPERQIPSPKKEIPIPVRPPQISRLRAPGTMIRSSTITSSNVSVPTSVASGSVQLQSIQSTSQISSLLPDIVQNTLHNNNSPIMTVPVLPVVISSPSVVNTTTDCETISPVQIRENGAINVLPHIDDNENDYSDDVFDVADNHITPQSKQLNKSQSSLIPFELTNTIDTASPHSWLTAPSPMVEPPPVLTPATISQPPLPPPSPPPSPSPSPPLQQQSQILLEPSELVDSVSLILNQLQQQQTHQHIESISEDGDNMDEDEEYGEETRENKVVEHEPQSEQASTTEKMNQNGTDDLNQSITNCVQTDISFDKNDDITFIRLADVKNQSSDLSTIFEKSVEDRSRDEREKTLTPPPPTTPTTVDENEQKEKIYSHLSSESSVTHDQQPVEDDHSTALSSSELSIPSRTSSITSQSSALNKRKVFGHDSSSEPLGKKKTSTPKVQTTTMTRINRKNPKDENEQP